MNWPERRSLTTGTFLAPSTRTSSGCIRTRSKSLECDASTKYEDLNKRSCICMKRFESQVILVAVLVLASIGSATAQTSKGFVVGIIEDQNGASIPNAAVKITNLTTGVTRDTVADSNGSFRLDAVDPGAYKLEASAQGFKTSKLDRIEVNAAQTVNISLRLEIGTPTEEVVVSAGNDVVIQNADGTRVNTLGEREIRELPVQGLNPVNLVFTLPGVTDVGGANGAVAGGFVQGTE